MRTTASGLGRATWGRRALWLTALVLAPAMGVPQERTDPLGERALPARFESRLEAQREMLIAIRRDLHRHPEISGREERTAGLVAERLAELGFEVRAGVGGHGVVGLLEGLRSTPLLAFRADMDAVPSPAPDPVDFASEVRGVRHICGHDIHTTVGLALAEGLAAMRDQLPGSVLLVFQPAEETATGARAMLADDVFGPARPEAIYAFHTAPLEIGQVATTPGGMMAARDRVLVQVTGAGDLDAAAAKVRETLLEVSTVPPGQAAAPTADRDFVLVQAGPPRSESDSRAVSAMVTVASSVGRERARSEIETRLGSLALGGVSIDHEYVAKAIAGVTNAPELTRSAMASARELLGDPAVIELTTVVPAFSEDFGSFQDEVPGVMFFLGVSNSERGWVGMPHSPGYVADEESIFVGARVMAAVLLDRMAALARP